MNTGNKTMSQWSIYYWDKHWYKTTPLLVYKSFWKVISRKSTNSSYLSKKKIGCQDNKYHGLGNSRSRLVYIDVRNEKLGIKIDSIIILLI